MPLAASSELRLGLGEEFLQCATDRVEVDLAVMRVSALEPGCHAVIQRGERQSVPVGARSDRRARRRDAAACLVLEERVHAADRLTVRFLGEFAHRGLTWGCGGHLARCQSPLMTRC
jgi:hypothetical protein